jgi:hypothetical protein
MFIPTIFSLLFMCEALHRLPEDENLHQTKVYAIVFPQFHSDPLNDKIWGTNFTDWDRLRRAPLFNKLGQEILRPSESVGYYNLLDFDVRSRYRSLAEKYNVDGFLYYHYWWNKEDPKSALTGPLERLLQV